MCSLFSVYRSKLQVNCALPLLGVPFNSFHRTSGEKVSPEDLVAQGRREAACGKYQEAATLFEEACSEL